MGLGKSKFLRLLEGRLEFEGNKLIKRKILSYSKKKKKKNSRGGPANHEQAIGYDFFFFKYGPHSYRVIGP